MKPFIMGVAALLLAVIFYAYNNDYALNKRANEELKYVCEEASGSATLFTNSVEQSEGKVVFNQVEATKAVEAQIKDMLKLDSALNPLSNSYWKSKVSYSIYFYDDSNTSYPYLFTDPDTSYTKLIKQPTVIVTINAGYGRYTLSFLKNLNLNIRSAAHTWEGR